MSHSGQFARLQDFMSGVMGAIVFRTAGSPVLSEGRVRVMIA